MFRVINRLDSSRPARHIVAVTQALAAEWPALLVIGPESPAESLSKVPTLNVRRVPEGRSVRPIQELLRLSGMRRLIAVERPWLLETHMAKAGSVGRLAASMSTWRPKTVHVVYGHALTGQLRALPTRALLEVERGLARGTDRLVAITSEIRDEMLAFGVGRPAQWRVIPVGVAPEDAGRKVDLVGGLRGHIGIPPDVCLAGSFARLSPVQDYATLIEAVRRTPSLHLVIAGESAGRAALEKQVVTAGLGDRIHLAGWWEGIPGVMSEVDIVVLASPSGASSTALMEAARAGRAVVATDVGGVRDIVHDGESGLVVPPGDPEALARGMRELQRDGSKRRAMGQAARVVADSVALEGTLDALRQLYGELGAPV